MQDLLLKLYHHNHRDENWPIQPYGVQIQKPNDGFDPQWGGGRARRLLQAAYTLAFLCLLYADEVLKVQVHDIEVVQHSQRGEHLVIKLPFRKTHQYGGE